MDPMKAILFNIHDLVLVFVLGLCGLLALLSSLYGKAKLPSRNFLTAFFVLNAMIAFDTLVFWGDGVKYAAFELSPWLLTLFSFAAFAFGPILYWAIRAELGISAALNWKLGLHLLPAVLTPLYLYWVCYQFPLDAQRELILNLGVYSIPEAHFSTFMTLKKLSPFVYGAVSTIALYKHSDKLNHSVWSFHHLLYLTAGFTFLRFWILVTHGSGLWFPSVSADVMGILSNYMTLALMAGIVIFSLRAPSNTLNKAQSDADATAPNPVSEPEPTVSEPAAHASHLSKHPTKPGLPARIQALMLKEAPYLNAQLNLNRFAEMLDETPRQVSHAINRAFDQNFQEFINGYRIEHAKRLLSDPKLDDLPIIEIAHRSGFNSKATFNRHFKQSEDMSPSTYRDASRFPVSDHHHPSHP